MSSDNTRPTKESIAEMEQIIRECESGRRRMTKADAKWLPRLKAIVELAKTNHHQD